MANFNAADVKKLREETDAPMMECKAALDEAEGDFEKAKNLLREKGKAAAAKRADRNTSEGVATLSVAHDHKRLGGVVLECETDFVARNEDFVQIAQELAEIFLHNDPGSDPLTVKHGDKTVGQIVEEAVAKIRENIKITKAIHETTEHRFSTYVHHDRKKAVAVEVVGTAENVGEAGYKVAIQSVAFPPEFIHKDEVPKEKVDAEMEVQTQRAINEGKTPDIAKNIAMGRINKEFFKEVVLLEQPYYADPTMSVSQYLQQEAKQGGGTISIARVIRLAVGG